MHKLKIPVAVLATLALAMTFIAAAKPDLPTFLGGRHQSEVGTGHLLGHSLASAAEDLARQLTA